MIRGIWRKLKEIIHPPIPPKVTVFETKYCPKDPVVVKMYNTRKQNTRYRRWRKVRNEMARESRRINRAS